VTFSTSSVQKGDVAFVSQSGALWSYISDLDLSFSGFVSLGNMADLEFYDWIEYFSKDEKTKKIVLYIERVKDGKKFIEVCKNSKKEIVVVKAGKTEQGSIAAVSHTGSIATDYDIYRGAFKQAGVRIAESLGEAFGIDVKNFPIQNEKVRIITNAGGAGSLIADKVVENNNELVEQPNDILGTAQAQDYEKEIKKLEEKNFNGKLLIVFTPQKMGNAEELAKVIIDSKLKENITAFFLGKKSVARANEFLKNNGVRVVDDI
jgi:acyl-CoA synthetase (NDP forming)